MGSWSAAAAVPGVAAPLLEGIPERDEPGGGGVLGRDERRGSEGESLLSSPRSEPLDPLEDLPEEDAVILLDPVDRDSVLDDENASSISIPDTESSIHDSEDSVLGSPSFNRDFTNLDTLVPAPDPGSRVPVLPTPDLPECHYDFTKAPPPDVALPTSIPPTLNAILRQSRAPNGLSCGLSALRLDPRVPTTNLDSNAASPNLNEPLQLEVPSPLDAVLDMTKQVKRH